MAERLVERRRVLPLLDGLDELAREQFGQAMRALEAYAAEGGPLVATCRSNEYDDVVTRTGTFLTTAAAVELEPVEIGAALEYLSYPETAQPRWEPVFAHLRALITDPPQAGSTTSPDPLAAALSTPLMVSLARTTYRQPSTQPADLIQLGSKQAVTDRLLDTFVTVVYTDRTAADNDRGAEWRQPGTRTSGRGTSWRRRAYEPARARRWLESLAYHLFISGARDWRWWQLRTDLFAARPGLTRASTVMAAVTLSGLIAGLIGLLVRGNTAWAAASGAAVMAVAAAGWLEPLWSPGSPRVTRAVFRTSRRIRLAKLGLQISHAFGGAALAALILGEAALVLIGGSGYAALIALVPVWHRVTPPHRAPGAVRVAALTATQQALIGGSAFALFATLTDVAPVEAGVTAALIYGAMVGLTVRGWAWTRYRLTHARLALGNRLPWRLQPFLAHAHQHGLLRQAGLTYQYRHAVLQDHLALRPRLHNLRARAATGDRDATWRLAELLSEQGRNGEAIEVLRAYVDTHPSDTMSHSRLVTALSEEGRIDEVIDSLRARAQTGNWWDWSAPSELVRFLEQQDRVDEAIEVLRQQAVTGDRQSRTSLADRLAERGRVDEAIDMLRSLAAEADADDRYAAHRLVDLLVNEGRLDDVRALAVSDSDVDGYAARRSVRLLVEQDRVDEAIEVLRLRAEAGTDSPDDIDRVAWTLNNTGRGAEARNILQARADADGWSAAWQGFNDLIDLENFDILMAQTTAGWSTAWHLDHLLAETGRITALEARDAAQKWSATWHLDGLLAAQGRIGDLKSRADAGGWSAAWHLVGLLADQGSLDELAVWAEAGNGYAARRFADLLAGQGRVDEAINVLQARIGAEADDTYAARQLLKTMVQRGRVDEAINVLRTRIGIDTDEVYVLHRSVDMLTENDRLDDAMNVLRAPAADGDLPAARQLADMLARQGRVDEAIDVLRPFAAEFADDRYNSGELPALLAKYGRVDDLRALAGDGNWHAAHHLADIRAREGRLDEAVEIVRPYAATAADSHTAIWAAELLAEYGRIDEAVDILRARLDSGDAQAAGSLARLGRKRDTGSA
ncbi:tetratricopeptide repeat protein [Actinoplanes auranticolor]|uniref:tetratricopeptide repeat protein n=1 Tax=Actinoplanes auranticolor TaxID=47988 RepID=UPI001BB43639|nr:hypothetical protein [Actinoplanes auranticolor]